MTKHASLSSFLNSRPDIGMAAVGADHGRLSESELSVWAEQSTIKSGNKSRFGRLGTLAFWTVVAGLLIARFFVVDPAKLRPENPPTPLASVAIPKT
jgi:hypothetical protein